MAEPTLQEALARIQELEAERKQIVFQFMAAIEQVLELFDDMADDLPGHPLATQLLVRSALVRAGFAKVRAELDG